MGLLSRDARAKCDLLTATGLDRQPEVSSKEVSIVWQRRLRRSA